MRTPVYFQDVEVAEGLEHGDNLDIPDIRSDVLDTDGAASSWSLDNEQS